MGLEYLEDLKKGYNSFTEIDGNHSEMLMDCGVYKLENSDSIVCYEDKKETAFLLLYGTIKLETKNENVTISRQSVFEDNPWCLHIPKGVTVKITALIDSEVLVQKTVNHKDFPIKLYGPNDCRADIFGEGVWNDTARRVVRTIFDYNNAPYSNMVMGEVINYPGKWSSYIPHHHPQPEIYYYRFNKSQGFGCSIIGDEVYKIKNNSISAIPGGLVHPQVAAPGYAMYYCWMIRHLENNPWTDRVDEDQHKWLLEKEVKIWPDK